jgi:tRNA (guanine-N7-)-methyltransferase
MRKPYLSLAPLIAPQLVEKPVDWPARFGRVAPMELEIGCGNGEYLARLASEQPDRDFIGIERMWGRVKKGLRKLALAERGNARLIHGEAGLALHYLIPPRSLARVHTLFPCPWPGDEAGRHRLYGPAFLALVNSRLVEGGEVILVTDDRDYFDWVLAQLPGSGFEARIDAVGARHDTKFERKWVEGGQAEFHRLWLEKREHHEMPLREEPLMQNPRIQRFQPEAFRLDECQVGEVFVRGLDMLHDPARRRAMIRVVVAEPDLTQELWISIRPSGEGWQVATARGTGALMTDGVQTALELVAEAAAGPA